ncbi:MAG: transposase, partial [Bacteroidales bacterium]|nr:transposase [Bacteroidales bacterium]
PVAKDYNIEQKNSDNGNSMKQIHIIIHQVKAWLRSTFSWVHEGHIEKYLDEFSFRLNRSIYRQNIFHSLIFRMINAKPSPYHQIKIST